MKLARSTTNVATRLLAAYHRLMDILKDGDKEVVKFKTPAGVTGYIATCIPLSAIEAFAARLEKKIQRRERRESLKQNLAQPGPSKT